MYICKTKTILCLLDSSVFIYPDLSVKGYPGSSYFHSKWNKINILWNCHWISSSYPKLWLFIYYVSFTVMETPFPVVIISVVKHSCLTNACWSHFPSASVKPQLGTPSVYKRKDTLYRKNQSQKSEIKLKSLAFLGSLCV